MILYNRMYERIYLNLTNTNCKKENFLLYKDPVYKPTCVATKLALKLVSDDACLKCSSKLFHKSVAL